MSSDYSTTPSTSYPGDNINLVEEKNAWRLSSRALEQIANVLFGFAGHTGDQLGAGNAEHRKSSLTSDAVSQQCLAASWMMELEEEGRECSSIRELNQLPNRSAFHVQLINMSIINLVVHGGERLSVVKSRVG